jgi:hypothetical protein
MLIPGYLLEVLQDWSEDNFVASFCSDQSQAFLYDVVAANVAD